jgi:L-threonylcarbamoyladenylate synthase
MNTDSDAALKLAVQILNRGEVVAFPTETVYGLGARIDLHKAIDKIFSTKKRPFFDPLIVHVDSIERARQCFADWNKTAEVLAQNFWPGPLTIVMEKSAMISDVITSGLPRVGVRVPRHPLALELLKQVGVPVAAPSANRFGKTSPTTASHVKSEFGNEVFVLDSAPCEIGIESTVLLIKSPSELSLLRKGSVLRSQIEDELHKNSIEFQWIESVSKIESPGHMKHHYMPEIPFVISKNVKITVKELSEKVYSMLNEIPDEIENVKIIKPKNKISKIEFLKLADTPEQAAREIYSQLRKASERKPDLLCLVLVKDYSQEKNAELWESVFDRLFKAASLIIEE